MNNYDVRKINEDTYLINDEFECSVYVIIGKIAALVIDTGMPSTNNLLNEIRKITDKNLIVAITHAHYDHIGHINEFASYYLSKKDLINLKTNEINLTNCIFFDDEIQFDLGNKIIKGKVFEGHSHGSCVFIDENNKNIFTGDQFGSGCGAWLQVYESVNISAYKKSINNFLNYLKDNYSFDINLWNLYGGHYGQEKASRVSDYNPLNIALVENMDVLCDKLLNNELELQECKARQFNNETSYYVQYKTAELVIRKSLIK